jgi:hypothetical protein
MFPKPERCFAAKENVMKRFLMGTAALTLSLAVFGTAEAAKGDHGRPASRYPHGSGGSSTYYPATYDHWHGPAYHNDYHKEFTGPYYKGEHNPFWSSRYWSDSYGCYLHWCPRTRCWFYWCAPLACYNPTDYCPTGRYAY